MTAPADAVGVIGEPDLSAVGNQNDDEFGLTHRSLGQFVAIDAASGKTLWNTQGREGEHASMIGSRSWLLASTTDGTLVIARANPQKYEEVRRYQTAQSAVWAHPAVTGSSIIVKDIDKVICWSF